MNTPTDTHDAHPYESEVIFRIYVTARDAALITAEDKCSIPFEKLLAEAFDLDGDGVTYGTFPHADDRKDSFSYIQFVLAYETCDANLAPLKEKVEEAVNLHIKMLREAKEERLSQGRKATPQPSDDSMFTVGPLHVSFSIQWSSLTLGVLHEYDPRGHELDVHLRTRFSKVGFVRPIQGSSFVGDDTARGVEITFKGLNTSVNVRDLKNDIITEVRSFIHDARKDVLKE